MRLGADVGATVVVEHAALEAVYGYSDKVKHGLKDIHLHRSSVCLIPAARIAASLPKSLLSHEARC